MGLAYFVTIKVALLFGDRSVDHTVPQSPVMLVGALSGFAGSLIDSLLGGWLQYSGNDDGKFECK